MNDLEHRISRLEFYAKLLAGSSECKMTAYFINNDLSEREFDDIHCVFEMVSETLNKKINPDRLYFEEELNRILQGRGSVGELVMCMGLSERWLNVCRWYRGH